MFLKSILSLELISSKTYVQKDFQLISEIEPSFCSIVWTTTSFNEINDIHELKLAKQLIDIKYNVLLHLPGRNFIKKQIMEILEKAKKIGIKNILALKGDDRYIKENDDSKCDFPYAIDLIKFIQKHFQNDFIIGVAGYPEKHSTDAPEHFAYFMEKASYANFIITQACYEYEVMENFFLSCRKNDIHLPIVFGIFIINSYDTLITMSNICQITIPQDIREFFQTNQNNTEALENFTLHFTRELVGKLLSKNYCTSVQLFCLNNINIVKRLSDALKYG